ncbi:hypothetical protein [Thalassospira povalilytica]|uniref:SMODS-associating 2TM beta-strand rich effector domain-containing protein n=1 Tax=Thalassospira povalilytica TaxID=732237 RepID=A0ABX4RCL8_9PROT|nr:hypothetical protein [Thalassospira povalilytica]PKR52130.1 hypothetical protein CU041_00455 [Thalassospira povalilytica]
MVRLANVRSWLFKNLTYIMTGLGITLILLPLLDIKIASSLLTAEIKATLSSMGQAILAGGVFNAIVKSHTFLELFSDALRKIVYAEESLSGRKDIEDIWNKVTIAHMSWKFDDLTNGMLSEIQKRILSNENYYYEEIRRNIKINWLDKNKKSSFVEEETVKSIIIPHSKSDTVKLHFQNTPDQISDGKKSTITIEKLSVEEFPKTDFTQFAQEKDGRTTYSIELSGEEKYTLIRKTRKIHPIGVEPDSRYLFRTYVRNWHLMVETDSKDISVIYRPLAHSTKHLDNNLDEKGPQNKATKNHPINISGESILHPWTGYMLLRQKS